MLKTILFSFVLVLFSACAHEKNSSSSKDPSDEDAIQQALIGDLNQASDPITIQEAVLSGNILKLTITYGGGCQEHAFSLVGSAAISKSLPPRRAIKLIHHSMGDNCKKLVTEKLYFSLNELAYKKEPGSTIFLDLNGYTESIEYKFQ